MSSPPLTLRKPSPAPLAAVADFIDRGDDADAAVTSRAATQAPSPAPMTPVETEVPARPRRAARAAASTATPTSLSQLSDVPSFTRASRSVAERRTKPHRRRTTVYFDLDVARDLAAKLGSDEDMSDVVNAAVRTYLATL